ncbi:MAG: hypothetical protein DSY82_03700 [Flavobacteriia bacterium]|nr:MAG: hypothetical protein DSY82_03700 [Flavobacteriia bacterium]
MLNKYFLTVLFTLSSTVIFSQKTYIPDDYFEKALIDLGIDKDGTVNDSVATADIKDVKTLDIHGKLYISDLTGIEDFTALETLDCSQNKISNLNLSSNTHLKELKCVMNGMRNLDVSNNTKLESLNCAYNQLNHLDITNSTKLRVLAYSNNNISNLNLSPNIQLEKIYCSHNSISTIDLSNNTKLKELDISLNYFSSIDLSKNIQLEKLQCHQNPRLKQLDVSTNVNLSVLNCLNNHLTALDLHNNVKLKELRCNNNDLTMLNIRNSSNSIITYFDATSNPDLKCIQVDDEAAANNGQAPYTNWKIDNTASYSNDCQYSLGIDKFITKTTIVYPNPVKNDLYIDSQVPLIRAEIYSTLGKRVSNIDHDINTISTDNLNKGIYFIKLYSSNGIAVKKLIKE